MSIFTKSNFKKPNRNTFDLTHDRKFSTEFGRLTPCLLMDVVPGDNIDITPSSLVRFAPLIAPVMHRASVYMHFFFVPNRIVWPGWEDFITGGEDGLDATVPPTIQYNPEDSFNTRGSLADYLGLPVNGDALGSAVQAVNAIPFMGYHKIYNEYYRAQDIVQPIIQEELEDGDNTAWYEGQGKELWGRAWQHDYFTSALPYAQKGTEALLPLGLEAPIFAKDAATEGPLYTYFRDSASGTAFNLADIMHAGGGAVDQESMTVERIAGSGNFLEGYVDINGTNYADLSQATAASITDLRRAFALQQWLEKNARGGSRYIESNKVHFGVNSSNKALQRPQYLGGTATPINISEVLQTSASQDSTSVVPGTPQGTMAGHGVSVGGGQTINCFAEEHGYIFGIMSVMPKTAYQQGIHRHWTRNDKFDYFWPDFQHIGEQAVLNKEIVVEPQNQENVFGYVPRYAEYKYMNDSVHGDFKQELDFWHMGRKFSSVPFLNQDFIQCDPQEVDRIFAVPGTQTDPIDNLWVHVLNNVKARRPMAYFGNPKQIV